MRIPFNQPHITDLERRYLDEALASGHYSGDGPFTKRCHAFLEQTLGVKKALLTTSCTHALEMCALLLDIQPGDEVILPSYTFVSTANAFALRGAKLAFIDIRPDTMNCDEKLLPGLITKKTKAIVVVHYAGVGCEMDTIMDIANAHGIPVVEDNAHGLFGKYKGRWLGTFGALATQSFHETKNISCGEGGALLINDERYIERAEIIREKGTNRSRFFRGQVDKYTWVDIGSSYLPSDILAAILLGQLERWQEIQQRRREIWMQYDDGLRAWAQAKGIRQPIVPAECDQAWHMYYLLMPNMEYRTAFIAFLKERGILAVFHYLPLHQSTLADAGNHQCPVTERDSDQLVRLPFFSHLSQDEQTSIIKTACEFGS
jgi:dTDP-4-amino-4,6-dideoxygalactose transaminase